MNIEGAWYKFEKERGCKDIKSLTDAISLIQDSEVENQIRTKGDLFPYCGGLYIIRVIQLSRQRQMYSIFSST